jgi:preprotein translocase subunit SecA
MFKNITRRIGGDPIRRQLDSYSALVDQINALEPEIQSLDDEALRAKTGEFKARLEQGETLEDVLPEAFAVVREVSVRTIGLRQYDVQLIGGVVLHEGMIAEMRTGEGKTLVATLPIYLNALEGKGVHLVTVNDYLARRDARWMGPVFHFLGLSVGILQQAARTEGGRKAFIYDPERESAQEDAHQLRLVDRKQAYAADVTYGTNNEFGFDYLRDNMTRSLDARSQRGHHYAILDEVDNILIDEARTPLIISGPSHDEPELYVQMAAVVKQLRAEDLEVSERDRTVSLTEIGEDHVEQLVGTQLRDPDRPEDITPEQARLLGHIEQALRAEHLFKRNKNYVVQGGRVVIVDEFTGRMMAGRRWSDGLHQAVEAKEGVRVRQENVTYATVTLQNYFRMYEKLSGMTGTALTEAEEFNKIYSVDVLPLPTNLEYQAMQPDSTILEIDFRENGNQFVYYAGKEDIEQSPIFWKRKDYPDVVYRTEEAKLRAVTAEILQRHALGQPMLVGTTSVELSEVLSKRLRAEPLQRMALAMILRDAYLEAHNIPEDGLRVEELEILNTPIDRLKPSDMRSVSKPLEISLNPARPENMERLAHILGLESSDQSRLGEILKTGIRHNVLNAKKHTEESQIIENAGGFGAVTIATNMAGRGVDIVLGGSLKDEIAQKVTRVARDAFEKAGRIDDRREMARMLRAGAGTGYGKASHIQRLEDWRREFPDLDRSDMGIYEPDIEAFDHFISEREQILKLGGLHVIGCVRHEARRIDNQLRGRAARQGDPGSSQFFLSLEDELMRLFGGSQVSGLMQRFNIDDAMPIAHNIVNRTIEQAQSRVEGANFDTRKHLLEYDDVLNQQRDVFYGQRNRVFAKGDLSEDTNDMLRFEVERHIQNTYDDRDGAWKLLAWLEETQPTLNVETDDAYPSFMLQLLLDKIAPIEDPETLKTSLIEIAGEALQAQHEYLKHSLDLQIDRSVERIDNQVDQRVEMAEMAIEGALIEAEETGSEVDARAMISAVESAAGMRLKIDDAGLRHVQSDPQAFRVNVPQLIEGSLGIRVWAGLVQTFERRIGEPLGMDMQIEMPIDWDAASTRLQTALDRVWESRAERVLDEIKRDLEAALSREKTVDEALATRLLVRMSYGQQAFFDRKTHQRRSKMIARLSYAFSAGRMLEGETPESLEERVLKHLDGGYVSIQRSIGRAELARLSGTRFADLDQETQTLLSESIDEEMHSLLEEDKTIASLPDSVKEQLSLALGQMALSKLHQEILLSVGDRLWVDYLTQMEALRTSIGLEAYAQRDPLVQYKSRAFDMFGQLLDEIRSAFVSRMFRIRTGARAQTSPAVQSRPTKSPGPSQKKNEPKGKKRQKKRRRRRR